MKIYLAGLYSNGFGGKDATHIGCDTAEPAEKAARLGVKHYLESYYYVGKRKRVDEIRHAGAQIFLDSGAYSAFTLGTVVNLKAYCRYIRENDDIIAKEGGIACVSVLDSIGDPLQTWHNQQEMEKQGSTPLPCFHYGEDERYLEYYSTHYDYITLGGMVPISSLQLLHWLDRIWTKYLTDPSGNPKVQVHGFGLTTKKLLERYPWTSVDSSSWVMSAAHGTVLIPGLGPIAFSEHSPARKISGQHYDSLPPVQQQAISEVLDRLGFSKERLKTNYLSRWAINCLYFTDLSERLNETVLKAKQINLF